MIYSFYFAPGSLSSPSHSCTMKADTWLSQLQPILEKRVEECDKKNAKVLRDITVLVMFRACSAYLKYLGVKTFFLPMFSWHWQTQSHCTQQEPLKPPVPIHYGSTQSWLGINYTCTKHDAMPLEHPQNGPQDCGTPPRYSPFCIAPFCTNSHHHSPFHMHIQCHTHLTVHQ